jgi:hypothetical protein
MQFTDQHVHAGMVRVMRTLLSSLWPIFLADLGVHVLGILFVQDRLPPVATSPVGWLLQILAFALVILAAYRASALAGTISFGIVAVGIYWFLWKPLMFAVTGALAFILGYLDWAVVSQAAIGAAVALLLFSPVALLLAIGGAYFGRRQKTAAE